MARQWLSSKSGQPPNGGMKLEVSWLLLLIADLHCRKTMRKLWILFLISPLITIPPVFAQSDSLETKPKESSVKAAIPAKAKTTASLSFRDKLLAHPKSDSTESLQQKPELQLRRLLTLDSLLFQYDTSRNNPAHRCYDFRRSLRKNTEFLFNFLSKQQYTPNALK